MYENMEKNDIFYAGSGLEMYGNRYLDFYDGRFRIICIITIYHFITRLLIFMAEFV